MPLGNWPPYRHFSAARSLLCLAMCYEPFLYIVDYEVFNYLAVLDLFSVLICCDGAGYVSGILLLFRWQQQDHITFSNSCELFVSPFLSFFFFFFFFHRVPQGCYILSGLLSEPYFGLINLDCQFRVHVPSIDGLNFTQTVCCSPACRAADDDNS